MKKKLLTVILGLCLTALNAQQIVSLTPPFATASDNNVSITYDASLGNMGLLNEPTIYAHTGVITSQSTSSSDWKYVVAAWSTNLPKALLTRVGSSNLYTLNIGNIRSYYGVPANETILKLAFVFRNPNGSKTGKTASGGDIFVDVNQGIFQVKLNTPLKGTFFNSSDSVTFRAGASDKCTLKLFANGQLLDSLYNDSFLNHQVLFSDLGSGRINLVLEGDKNGTKAYDTTYIIQRQSVNIAVSPAGINDGINYLNDSTVVLQLYAPYKNFVYLLGDFNNWEFYPQYLMNKTPDGLRYWIQIGGLSKGKEYGFQYCIDDIQMKVADVYADKVLDPYNDKYISSSTYPGLMPYPVGKTTEVVSVLQTAQPAFNWQVSNFNKPDKNRLVVYELLLRDFIGTHDFKTLKDTISYLKRVGVNCVQLMPVMEFEGNESWGYNPMFYFALDKYYGTKTDMKLFVDECHKNGIAVVLDIALNHSFGQNPQVRMYFDPTQGPYGQPTAQNPWFNQVDKHPYGVGYDYNHEAQPTRDFIDRVIKYWISEYHVDGYRFDLSKGFTQKNTLGNVSAWNAFDQSRIDNWSRIKSEIVKYAPDAYLILEHLSDNTEEQALAAMGFILWGKMTDNYAEAMMGYNNSKANLSWGNYKSRNFSVPNLITYAESHDEERVMYSCLTYGNSNANYSSKDLNTALKRAEAYHALLLPLIGPKMIWMGGELGYEVSINSTSDKTAAKPFRWNYLNSPQRLATLEAVGKLAKLKQHISFTSTSYVYDVANTLKVLSITHDSMNTIIAGNFDIVTTKFIPSFQHIGWWYNYMTGDSVYVNGLISFDLAPGAYVVYTDRKLSSTGSTGMNELPANTSLAIYPNPSKDHISISLSQGKIDHVSVYSLHGELLIESSPEATHELLLKTEKLSPGMYLLRIDSGAGSYSRKIIVE